MRPVLLALAAAILFGASTPASKALLAGLSPLQLAGLLYLGAGIGVIPLVLRERARRVRARWSGTTRARIAGAVVFGGMLAPALLLFALRVSPAGSVSLLLNLELVATALIGVLFFREQLGRSGWMGVIAAVAAGALISFEGGTPGLIAGALAAGACVCWGIDNNLTALIDGISPAETTMWKGLVAGTTNLALGLALAPLGVSGSTLGAALVLGMLCYGASIVLYISAAQQLGAARSQAVFASAPFVGAALSCIFLGEPLEWPLLAAGPLFVLAIALSFRDRHQHEHAHEAQVHVHAHSHDDGHHDHEHVGLAKGTRHSHQHAHVRVTHTHRHLPDLHHRHGH